MSLSETDTFKVTSLQSVRAACGRETLILSFDGEQSTISVDEHDNGVIVQIKSDRTLLEQFCRYLPGPKRVNGGRFILLSEPTASVILLTDEQGHELTVSVIGERERVVRFSHTNGELLRKAIRGNFGFWD